MANAVDKWILESELKLVENGCCRYTRSHKKLSICIDPEQRVFQISFDGNVVAVPFEVAAWLPPNMTRLYSLGFKHGVIEEWWDRGDDDNDE